MTRLEDISGEITSPKSCAGGGLLEHWTAVEARKKHEMAIRKDEREKVLDEAIAEFDKLSLEGWSVWKFRETLVKFRQEGKGGE